MSKVMPRATWPARMPKLAPVGELAVQIAATLLALLFAISSVLYLCLGYSPVTHQDYWRIYEFALNHTWLESALHKHAEHLIFFPSFFWLADLRFFHGKQLPLFWMGFTMLFLTIGLHSTRRFRFCCIWYITSAAQASAGVEPLGCL